jgi:hypothetical protein
MNNQDTDKYTVVFDRLRTPSPRAETHNATAVRDEPQAP